MAMMITRFNKILKSKALWVVILAVIVLVLGFGGILSSCGNSANTEKAEEAQSMGKLNGEYVGRADYRLAYLNSYLAIALSYGGIQITAEVDQYLQDAAWQRIAAKQQADELSLTASDREVIDAIKSHSGFLEQGRFYKAKYEAFIQQFLNRLGMTEEHFEAYVREEIVSSKLRRMIQQSVLITPSELDQTFHSLSDRFDIEYTVMDYSAVSNDVIVLTDDAQALFDEDPALYEIPEKVVVKYVSISISNFLHQITNVEETVLMDYYNEHLDEYLQPTNEVVESEEVEKEAAEEVADASEGETEPDTNDFFSSLSDFSLDVTNSVETIYKPYEDVKEEISKSVAWIEARELALDFANGVTYDLASDDDGNRSSFDAVMTSTGMIVQTSDPFSIYELSPIPGAPLTINQFAFRLDDSADDYYSDPVAGENEVFILALKEKREAYVPEFAEVKEDVMVQAYDKAVQDALIEKSKEIREEVEAGLIAGGSFSNLVETYGLNITALSAFSASSTMDENFMMDSQLVEVLLRGVIDRNAGEVSEWIPTEQGIVLLYVADRQSGDPSTFMSLRDQIVDRIRSERGNRLYEFWQTDLVAEGKLELKGLAQSADEEGFEDEETLDEEEAEEADTSES